MSHLIAGIYNMRGSLRGAPEVQMHVAGQHAMPRVALLHRLCPWRLHTSSSSATRRAIWILPPDRGQVI